MKKVLITLLAALASGTCFSCCAFADVAGGAIVAVSIGIPLLAVAVAIIAIVIIVRVVRKKNADKPSESQETRDSK